MKVLDRYILGLVVAYCAGFVGLALLVLLLERMLRLFDLTVGADGTLGYIGSMLLNLLPHYLEIALPAAFFLAVLLTTNRLSRNGELTAMHNSGVGLPRVLGTVMVIAIILAAAATSIVGVLQPHSRYTYRALVHAVAHQSLAAVVRGGAFVTRGNLTFLAEDRERNGRGLGKVFIYSKLKNGKTAVTTAAYGTLRPSSEGDGSVLALSDGVQTYFGDDGRAERRLRFDFAQRRLTSDRATRFRARGGDAREMTLTELWAARDNPPNGMAPAKIAAEFNGRLVRAVSLLVLPLAAIPLGLGSGRTGQSAGIAVGLLLLVVYQKSIQLGTSLGASGMFSPWLGAWLPFAMFTGLGAVLFARAAYRVSEPPLTMVSRSLEGVLIRLRRA